MSTVPSGLAALTQANNDLAAAVSGLTTAVSAAVANIATLNSELANSEDPAVQAIAANISTQIAKISDATAGLNAADAPPVVQPPADNPPATT